MAPDRRDAQPAEALAAHHGPDARLRGGGHRRLRHLRSRQHEVPPNDDRHEHHRDLFATASMQRDNPPASRAAKDGASLSARALLRRLRTGLFRTLAPMLPRPLETRREPERGAPPVAPGLTSSAKASGHRRIAVIGAAGFEPATSCSQSIAGGN